MPGNNSDDPDETLDELSMTENTEGMREEFVHQIQGLRNLQFNLCYVLKCTSQFLFWLDKNKVN